MALQAIIFDLDGVLIDSEPIGLEIAESLLKETGLSIDASDLSRFVGIPDRDFYASLASKTLNVDANLLAKHTELYEAALDSAPIIPGAIDAVRRCSGLAPLALVSGSTKRQIDRVLMRLGLCGVFKVTVSADDVEIGKPHPHGFRRAARKLGVQEIGCVVIEDSVSGLRAANEAGMATIAYWPTCGEPSYGDATTVISPLNEITEVLLRQVVNDNCSKGIKLTLHSGWQDAARRLGRRLRSRDYLFRADPFDPWSLLKQPRDQALYHLFCCGESVQVNEIQQDLGDSLLRDLVEIGLITKSGTELSSCARIVSAFGQLLLIDHPVSRRPDLWHSTGTYLDESTINYICSVRTFVGPTRDKSILEIGPGSGLACILFAQSGASSVLGLDIDLASVELSRFNAALNSVDGIVQIEASDMFHWLDGRERTFDIISFHPPYRIVPANLQYPNPTQRIGPTEDGLGLVRRFVAELDHRLNPAGLAVVSIQVPEYENVDKTQELNVLAQERGLRLNVFSTSENIGVDEVAASIATKFESKPEEITAYVKQYYSNLGIRALRPALLTISKSK